MHPRGVVPLGAELGARAPGHVRVQRQLRRDRCIHARLLPTGALHRLAWDILRLR